MCFVSMAYKLAAQMENDECDWHVGGGIEPKPAREANEQRGDGDAERHGGVRHHVEEYVWRNTPLMVRLRRRENSDAVASALSDR